MAKPRVGVQLIVFGEQVQTDFAGAVQAVAEAGYDGFEMGTIDSDAQLDQVNAARQAAGIVCTGCHAGFRHLGDPDLVTQLIRYTRAVEADFFFSSGSGAWKTLDDYRDAATVLNRVGRQCQDAGLTFCFHNHHWELQRIQGQTALHVMLAVTDPDLVKLCPDVYWLHVGGERPAEFIARYRDRIPYYHFKDGLGGEQYAEFRELGQGNVDLAEALSAALTTHPTWIVAEQDRSSLPPAESVRVSREYLRKLGV
jgi:sugar phosphate isomerase/epimerase